MNNLHLLNGQTLSAIFEINSVRFGKSAAHTLSVILLLGGGLSRCVSLLYIDSAAGRSRFMLASGVILYE